MNEDAGGIKSVLRSPRKNVRLTRAPRKRLCWLTSSLGRLTNQLKGGGGRGEVGGEGKREDT